MQRLFLILLLLVAGAALLAQEAPAGVDDALRVMSSVRGFYQTAISPDGTRVAWVQKSDGGTAIYVVALNAAGQARRISGGGEYEDQLAWSPDGKQIAFLSDTGKPGQQQLYVSDAAGGNPRKLTDLTGSVSTPAWAPDGRGIAFLFIENSPRAAGPLQPMTPPSGPVEEHIYEQRINVVDVNSGKVRAISPADMYVYEYDWLPNGKGFVATAAYGDGDNNWWIAQLYAIAANGDAHSLYKPKWQIANPRVSPDGAHVAFIEGLMSDQGVTGGDVFMLPLETAQATPRNLTPNMPASATWLTWTGPGQIVFSELVDGNSGVAAVDTSGKRADLWSGPELISAGAWEAGISLARDGKQSAVVRSSAQHPPEVWAGPIGNWKQITGENREVKAVWGEQRSVQWQSEGLRVQGWLLLPRNFNPRGRYPLVVEVHGGPASACTPGWPNGQYAPLAAAGYFVLCPNPRGSYGQGETFTQGNVKDFGGGDFRDIMAGVDQVLREFPIDPHRLGIKGWSYGGYMTMWAETQTNRFGAAVAGAGLSNWLSYYGENDIDQWMVPYFGATVYDDPAVYARSGPINFVKNVKTPTLVLVGERDGECPAPQSFEWWHALKTFHVPVQLVVYPDEGHMIRKPEHRRDIAVRTVEWFDKWLSVKPQPVAQK